MPSAIDLSSFAGLTAMVLLTINLLLGLLVTTNYNPRLYWPHRKIPIFKIHNWNAYLAIAVVCLHPVILLFSKTAGFHAGDVLWPLHSPGQRLYKCLGAATFYLIALVVVTSYLRPRLGSRPWKKLHYLAYLAAALLFVHGTLIDPDLKNKPTDFLDGEKVLVEACFALVAAASVWRWRYGKERQRHHAAKATAEKAA
jgi:DMSO/TMAO reductase YedYZ heme-binding membrane subunit